MTVYLSIQQDADALCEFAARHWVERCRQVLSQREQCHIALSGGSTPKMLYQRLASDSYRDQIDWSRLHIYFGDERCVPHEHSDSNYRMAKEAMLDRIALPTDHIHALPYRTDAEVAADDYEAILTRQFSDVTNFPRFDLVWLGMGDDGHTASLFPGTPALLEEKRWCAPVYVEKMQSWRVSLTYPVLNNAAEVCVLISGAAKAARLHQVLCTTGQDGRVPIMAIRPAGNLYWLLDTPAASSLSEECVAKFKTCAV